MYLSVCDISTFSVFNLFHNCSISLAFSLIHSTNCLIKAATQSYLIERNYSCVLIISHERINTLNWFLSKDIFTMELILFKKIKSFNMVFRIFSRKLAIKASLIYVFSIASMLGACSKDASQIVPSKEASVSLFKKKLVVISDELSRVAPSIKSKDGILNGVIAEQEIKRIMVPLVAQAKVLLVAHGLYDSLRAELGDNDINMLVAGLILMDQENKKSSLLLKSNSTLKANSVETNMVDEIDADELSECLLEAFGLGGASIAVLKESGKIAAKELAKLALKVAAKSVSWVGLAFTAYQLTNCLIEADLD